jgi:lipopolysaccharide transport system ATP-binding protein
MIVEFFFQSLDLGAGSYSLTAALHSGDEHTRANFDWWDRALVFEVLPGSGPVSIGVCALDVSASWPERDSAVPAQHVQ